MTGTTWTASREQLVRELAAARAENELLRIQYGNRLIQSRQRAAEYYDRKRKHLKAQAPAVTERVRQDAERILETLPIDPNAAWHRTTLEHELRKASA